MNNYVLTYWTVFDLNESEAKVWWDEAQEEVKRVLGVQFSNLKRAKNVIFFLGDGMGQTTVYLKLF